MSDKTVQTLDVEVDELSLTLVGWQVDEVAARLVTTTFDNKDHFQEIAISGTARFLPEDWSDRFGGGDYAPTLLVELMRRDSPVPASYERVVMETVKKASKRPQRFSEKSNSWECRKPLAPDEIRLRITAFDVEEVDAGLVMPPRKVSPLPVEVIDETTARSVRLSIATSSAHVFGKGYDAALSVHAAGSVEFGTANELLADYLASEDWHDQDATLDDECPFDVAVPGLVVEVMDEGGFLLQKREISLYGQVTVGESGKLPRRQPRWIADTGDNLDEYAGKPARVVIRIMDAEDL